MRLISTNTGAGKLYYHHNPHGDVTKLTNAAGEVVESFTYDAFGNQLTANGNNPFRYCGEYYDADTGFIYLRMRWYDANLGRFINEDPVKSGTNWYVYCGNNPVNFVDPSGLAQVALRAFLEHYGGTVGWNNDARYAHGTLNGRTVHYYSSDSRITNINGSLWIDDSILINDFDLYNSDTYRIINDLGSRWFATNDQNERNQFHNTANSVRAMERAGTPIQYAQDKVMNELNTNKQTSQGISQKSFATRSATLTTWAYDKDIWNYKYQSNWQVPYDYFNGKDMNSNNAKNWTQWMYFDGMLMSGDDFGNLNLAYCGVYMGLPTWVWDNFTTQDTELDIFWMGYGESMARQGR